MKSTILHLLARPELGLYRNQGLPSHDLSGTIDAEQKSGGLMKSPENLITPLTPAVMLSMTQLASVWPDLSPPQVCRPEQPGEL